MPKSEVIKMLKEIRAAMTKDKSWPVPDQKFRVKSLDEVVRKYIPEWSDK